MFGIKKKATRLELMEEKGMRIKRDLDISFSLVLHLEEQHHTNMEKSMSPESLEQYRRWKKDGVIE